MKTTYQINQPSGGVLPKLLFTCLFMLMAGGVMAADETNGIGWDQLSTSQQQLLARQKDNWATLPGIRQQALARGAQRWLDMDDNARVAAGERFQRWKLLPEEKKAQIRQNYLEFRALNADDQARMRMNFATFRKLDDKQREILLRKWNKLSAQERAQRLQNLRLRRLQP